MWAAVVDVLLLRCRHSAIAACFAGLLLKGSMLSFIFASMHDAAVLQASWRLTSRRTQQLTAWRLVSKLVPLKTALLRQHLQVWVQHSLLSVSWAAHFPRTQQHMAWHLVSRYRN
jgi:hypothetical protein